MERIQKALEQAQRQREKAGEQKKQPARAEETVWPTPVSGEEPAGHEAKAAGSTADASGVYKVQYTSTRVVDVPEQVLRDNRLIAAVSDHEYRDVYRMLRTRVLQSLRSNHWNTLAVSGAASGCGKTLTAINLAISLAMEVTQTVLLVDLDLRKPCVHKYFNYQPKHGISDYLFEDIPVSEMMFSPGIDRLVVLPGRESVHNSSEMLRSPKMLSLVEELKSRYPDRLIIVDLPPVLAADDALAFSPYIDAMLLVAENGETRKEHLERAIGVLKGVNIIGTVLNKSVAPDTGLGSYHADTPARRSS